MAAFVRFVSSNLKSLYRKENNYEIKEKKVGEIFKTKTKEFIVLEHFDNGTTAVLQKDFWEKAGFDKNTSNFAKSKIYRDLNENYYNELAEEIGADNIVEHEVDLIMDTGHKDYGVVKAKVSLLTADLFRKYVEILDNYNPHDWWWLATADSRQFSRFVRYVSSDGSLDRNYCFNDGGVRPYRWKARTSKKNLKAVQIYQKNVQPFPKLRL